MGKQLKSPLQKSKSVRTRDFNELYKKRNTKISKLTDGRNFEMRAQQKRVPKERPHTKVGGMLSKGEKKVWRKFVTVFLFHCNLFLQSHHMFSSCLCRYLSFTQAQLGQHGS